MPPLGSTEWMKPNSESAAQIRSVILAAPALRSMMKATAAPQSIAVTMKPEASMIMTPTVWMNAGLVRPVACIVPAGSIADDINAPL